MPTSKKSNSTRTSAAPAQGNEAPPFPRNLPMYFKGEQQSDEFARGAWAFRDALAKIEGHDTAKFSDDEITVALADEFNEHAGKGGDYSRGFMTATLEILATNHCIGQPDLDVWRPLRMELCYPDDGGPEPTPGSMLYELHGEAVSVAPDGTVHAWCGGVEEQRIERGEAFLARVQKEGHVLTQREFDAMWARVAPASGEATPTAAPEIGFEDSVMLPTPIDIVGHPAHDRISCATLAVHQLVVLTDELVDHVSVEPGDEGAFVAMALASRAHKLAQAASRLLSLPAKEIDFEACEAEVVHG